MVHLGRLIRLILQINSVAGDTDRNEHDSRILADTPLNLRYSDGWQSGRNTTVRHRNANYIRALRSMARCRMDIRSLGSDARVGLDWLPHVRRAKYNTATHPFVAFDFCLCGIRVCPFQVARFLNGPIDVSRDARFWRSRRQRRIWLFGVVSGYIVLIPRPAIEIASGRIAGSLMVSGRSIGFICFFAA